MEKRDASPPQLANDEPASNYREIADLQRELHAAEARSEALLDQLRATEMLLDRTRARVRNWRQKKLESEHYRSLLHDLRARWYLRPFIRANRLEPPHEEVDSRWIYRGPRFDPRRSPAGGEDWRPRVLMVGHLLSRLLFGSEVSLLEIIRAIDREKFDVFAVFPERNDEVFASLHSQVQGIAVLDYFWWRQDQPLDETAVAAFEAIDRELRIDLVHVNTIMVREPLVAARRVGIPAIINARELISLDHGLAAQLSAEPTEIARAVCENATYVLANSATTLADYPCGERGGFLYNCVDAHQFDLPNEIDASCIEVGMISSNLRKKGVIDFFELARMAREGSLPLRFHLIGPETALVRDWRTHQGELPANVRMRDYVSPPSAGYTDLNIVINLSRFAESFGRTVAEAMTARRPVIGYRHGALPELIDDGETGFLVPYLDLEAVLDRLRFFAENPSKIAEFGEKARRRATQRFSPTAFARELNALYTRLIDEARPAR